MHTEFSESLRLCLRVSEGQPMCHPSQWYLYFGLTSNSGMRAFGTMSQALINRSRKVLMSSRDSVSLEVTQPPFNVDPISYSALVFFFKDFMEVNLRYLHPA